MPNGPANNHERSELGRQFAATVGDVRKSSGTTSRTGLSFDVDKLGREAAAADDPFAFLAAFAVQARADESASALELRLAERLEEAGILAEDVGMPEAHVVRPKTSGLFYVRVDEPELPYLAKLRIIGIEAALNGALLCQAILGDPERASREDVVKAEQRVARSVVAQGAVPLAELEGEEPCGEWHDRHAIAAGIECLRLPYRLQARFRVNAARGVAAIECDLIAPRLMPREAYVDGLGVVETTAAMRRRSATDYNLRVLILMAAYVFTCTEDIDRVYVAGVRDTASSHACYASACVERADIEGLDLSAIEPVSFLRFLCATLDEADGELAPVQQGFSLNEALFCPKERFVRPELEQRRLRPSRGAALGCRYAEGIAVDERAKLREAARVAASRMGPSTADNVRMLLSLAGELDEPSLENPAKQVASALIDGRLDEGDPEAVAEAFLGSDELSAAVKRAQKLFFRGDPAGCAAELAAALAPIEAEGAYRDGPGVAWRVFDGYADRVLYNRLFSAHDGEVRLAPRSYLDALTLLSTADLLMGRAEAACEIARQAAHLAPLSTQAAINYSHCLEETGDIEAAVEECARLLRCASDTQSIGFAYIHMAGLHYKLGRMQASQACYQLARQVLPGQLIDAAQQIAALLGAKPAVSLSTDKALAIARAHRIPVAPSNDVAEVIYEAAAAACDENLFRPARELVYLLVALTRDDIYHGVLRSLEDEPDY
ncbi:hypothetical protein [Paratractidigestivibacter sp.]|uniref:hypothetical protein n=1 Tax=Paratractidigestivibacter sp. TaxID=2847316 RepID=UPI002ABE6795|nr:hypothetical protein [Paratractidigestivibacter sp.]